MFYKVGHFFIKFLRVGDFMKKMMSIFLSICFITSNVVYAGGGDSVEAITGSVADIVNAISYFGYAIALAMLAFVGIKYAMAPANEKADVKQGSINYLIGAFLIVCASGVATVFTNIATSHTDAGTLATEIVQKAQDAAGSVGGS